MAIPPDHYRYLSNTLEAERLAQLGWITASAAQSAIDEATRRATAYEEGDALKVLEERGLLTDEARLGLERDQASPAPWWKLWGARPHGPPATWDASLEKLWDELYEQVGGPETRARAALMAKVKAGDAERDAVFASLLAFRPRSIRVPCPLNRFMVWVANERISIPPDVAAAFLERAADDYLKEQLKAALAKR